MTKVLECAYNSQRDNRPTPIVGPNSQCGYTATAIFLSAWLPEAASDEYVYDMIDQLEPRFGQPGIGEKLVKIRPWQRTRMGAFIENYISFAEVELGRHGIGGQLVFVESQGSWEDLRRIIDQGSPAVFTTVFAPDGHFVTLVGYDSDDMFIFHDPYGDPETGYRGGRKGEYIALPISFIERRLTRYGLRYFYLQDPDPTAFEVRPEVIRYI